MFEEELYEDYDDYDEKNALQSAGEGAKKNNFKELANRKKRWTKHELDEVML